MLARQPKGKGPANWLDEETARELKAELAKGPWRRAQDARRWLEKKLGKKLTLVVTYKYLGKCSAVEGAAPGPSPERPRPGRSLPR